MNTPRSSKRRITSEFAVMIFIDVSFSKLFVIIRTLIIALETTYGVRLGIHNLIPIWEIGRYISTQHSCIFYLA